MKSLLIFWAILLFGPFKIHAQLHEVSGAVLDENREPLPGAHVQIGERATATDGQGRFSLTVKPGTYLLTCTFVGYQPYKATIRVPEKKQVEVALLPDARNLQEVVVSEDAPGKLNSLKTETADRAVIVQNYAGSLMKTLESMPGVNSMDIGASSAKPVIRGLGFSRVTVAENGIKQEGQQWGADHGLEIDPFHVEEAEVIKGAASIEYGSDAIGGVVNLDNSDIPEKGSLSGDATMIAKSVNQTIGGSASLRGRGDRWYFKARGTALDYGDYRVPTDRILYLTRVMPVHDERLKNTAGDEMNFTGTAGYLSPAIRSSLSVSNVSQRSGFFPGSHGVPDVERVADDGDMRNIGFPYQTVSHLKAISNNVLFLGDTDLHLDVGYQDNLRREWSEFHTHYAGQSPPEIDPDLEQAFRLRTLTVNGKHHFDLGPRQHIDWGVQTQIQDNTIDGYSFFLPEFRRRVFGVYGKSHWDINETTELTLGLRYDLGDMETDGFYDPVLYDFLKNEGDSIANAYAWRSRQTNSRHEALSGLAGVVFNLTEGSSVRFNAGKSFRLPTAVEKGANGVHHGSFRHESGADLSPEEGYYADAGIELSGRRFSVSVNPYFYYFKNFIFLRPTGEWSVLPHAGQVYQYTQSKAFHSGVEAAAMAKLGRLLATVNFEYLVNKQLTGDRSRNYPLPFTPPANGFVELEYSLDGKAAGFSQLRFFINGKFAASQNRIAQNEKPTPGYHVYGGGVKAAFEFAGLDVEAVLRAQNMFNARYFNHLSFYRNLEIPEPGRNIQLMLFVPFEF